MKRAKDGAVPSATVASRNNTGTQDEIVGQCSYIGPLKEGNVLINTNDPNNSSPCLSGPTSYANFVTEEPSRNVSPTTRKSVNFCTFITPARNEAYSWGMSSYARAIIELQDDVKLKDTIMVAMPKLVGEGFYMCTIRVKYEWKPPICSSCKVFSHYLDECSKNIGLDVVKILKTPRQAARGVQQVELSSQKVSNSNPFDALNFVEDDDNLGTNGGNSKSAEKGSLNVAHGSSSNTPIIEKIEKLERQILDGELMFVDDDGKPLYKVVTKGNEDSESEVEAVFDGTANLMASTSLKGRSDKARLSNSDALRHTINTTLVPPGLPTHSLSGTRRRPTPRLLILPFVSSISPKTIRTYARIYIPPIEPILGERARILLLTMMTYQLDLFTPHPLLHPHSRCLSTSEELEAFHGHDAEDHASNAQEEARQKKKEALEEVIQVQPYAYIKRFQENLILLCPGNGTQHRPVVDSLIEGFISSIQGNGTIIHTSLGLREAINMASLFDDTSVQVLGGKPRAANGNKNGRKQLLHNPTTLTTLATATRQALETARVFTAGQGSYAGKLPHCGKCGRHHMTMPSCWLLTVEKEGIRTKTALALTSPCKQKRTRKQED
ncbi:hypothetical protein Tco_1473940 [Tanacetum coccineum]